MSDGETRRAHGRWVLAGAPGAGSGEGEIAIDDDGVSAGPARVEFLDADALADENRVLTLALHPQGSLALSMLARRHETFATALAEARDAARVKGLLAHGIAMPTLFSGTVGQGRDAKSARILVFATHVTAVPTGADPFQVPYGAVTEVSFDSALYAVTLKTAEGPVLFSQLGRRTDELARAIDTAREAQGRRLAAVAGTNVFADGLGVAATECRDFDRLVDAWTAPERAEGVAALLAMSDRANARIGLVELLDPDEESVAAKVPLPENLAAFLLAPAKGKVVLEILSGPSAATYVFDAPIAQVNRDLQALHFRRRPLALTEKDVNGAAGHPYRLALRKLAPLARLRAATKARVIHTDAWAESLKKALSG